MAGEENGGGGLGTHADMVLCDRWEKIRTGRITDAAWQDM